MEAKNEIEDICDRAEKNEFSYPDALMLIKDKIEDNQSYGHLMLNRIKDNILKTDWKLRFFQKKHEITLKDKSKKDLPRKVNLIWDEIQKAEQGRVQWSDARYTVHEIAKSAAAQNRWSDERTQNYITLEKMSKNMMG